MIDLRFAACKRVWRYARTIVIVCDFDAVCDPACELIAMGWREETSVFFWRGGWWVGHPIFHALGPAAELYFQYPRGLGCPL